VAAAFRFPVATIGVVSGREPPIRGPIRAFIGAGTLSQYLGPLKPIMVRRTGARSHRPGRSDQTLGDGPA